MGRSEWVGLSSMYCSVRGAVLVLKRERQTHLLESAMHVATGEGSGVPVLYLSCHHTDALDALPPANTHFPPNHQPPVTCHLSPPLVAATCGEAEMGCTRR
jgi:hypothetical protein